MSGDYPSIHLQPRLAGLIHSEQYAEFAVQSLVWNKKVVCSYNATIDQPCGIVHECPMHTIPTPAHV